MSGKRCSKGATKCMAKGKKSKTKGKSKPRPEFTGGARDLANMVNMFS